MCPHRDIDKQRFFPNIFPFENWKGNNDNMMQIVILPCEYQ